MSNKINRNTIKEYTKEEVIKIITEKGGVLKEEKDNNLKFLCFMHEDTTASLLVIKKKYEEDYKWVYYCQVCSKGGSIYSLDKNNHSKKGNNNKLRYLTPKEDIYTDKQRLNEDIHEYVKCDDNVAYHFRNWLIYSYEHNNSKGELKGIERRVDYYRKDTKKRITPQSSHHATNHETKRSWSNKHIENPDNPDNQEEYVNIEGKYYKKREGLTKGYIYNNPSLNKIEDDDYIYILEGAAKVDIMNKYYKDKGLNNFVAISFTGGAGSYKAFPNKNILSNYEICKFKNRKIIIFVDNDQVGIENATILQSKLYTDFNSEAIIVNPVEVLGLDIVIERKKDIADYTKEEQIHKISRKLELYNNKDIFITDFKSQYKNKSNSKLVKEYKDTNINESIYINYRTEIIGKYCKKNKKNAGRTLIMRTYNEETNFEEISEINIDLNKMIFLNKYGVEIFIGLELLLKEKTSIADSLYWTSIKNEKPIIDIHSLILFLKNIYIGSTLINDFNVVDYSKHTKNQIIKVNENRWGYVDNNYKLQEYKEYKEYNKINKFLPILNTFKLNQDVNFLIFPYWLSQAVNHITKNPIVLFCEGETKTGKSLLAQFDKFLFPWCNFLGIQSTKNGMGNLLQRANFVIDDMDNKADSSTKMGINQLDMFVKQITTGGSRYYENQNKDLIISTINCTIKIYKENFVDLITGSTGNRSLILYFEKYDNKNKKIAYNEFKKLNETNQVYGEDIELRDINKEVINLILKAKNSGDYDRYFNEIKGILKEYEGIENRDDEHFVEFLTWLKIEHIYIYKKDIDIREYIEKIIKYYSSEKIKNKRTDEHGVHQLITQFIGENKVVPYTEKVVEEGANGGTYIKNEYHKISLQDLIIGRFVGDDFVMEYFVKTGIFVDYNGSHFDKPCLFITSQAKKQLQQLITSIKKHTDASLIHNNPFKLFRTSKKIEAMQQITKSDLDNNNTRTRKKIAGKKYSGIKIDLDYIDNVLNEDENEDNEKVKVKDKETIYEDESRDKITESSINKKEYSEIDTNDPESQLKYLGIPY